MACQAVNTDRPKSGFVSYSKTNPSWLLSFFHKIEHRYISISEYKFSRSDIEIFENAVNNLDSIKAKYRHPDGSEEEWTVLGILTAFMLACRGLWLHNQNLK